MNSTLPASQTQGVVEGKSKAWYLFGIGGFKKKTLIRDAMNDLHSKVSQADSVQLVNYVVDIRRSIFWVYGKVEVMVSANIVTSQSAYENIAEQEEIKRQRKKYGFGEGDKVLFFDGMDDRRATVVEIEDNSVVIRFEDGTTKEITSLRTARIKRID